MYSAIIRNIRLTLIHHKKMLFEISSHLWSLLPLTSVMKLSNWCFLSGTQSAPRWAADQQQTTKETEIEKWITHIPWKRYPACLWATWGGQGRERQDLENRPLLGSVSEVLWGSWVKAELADSNQNSGVLVSYTGPYLKGTKGADSGKQEKPVVTELLEKAHQLLTFPCESVGFSLGHVLVWGLVSV